MIGRGRWQLGVNEVDGGTSVEGGNFVEQDARFVDETVAGAGDGAVVGVTGGNWGIWLLRWGRRGGEHGVVFVNFVIAEALEDALRQRGERGLRRADGGSVGFAGASSCERWRRRCKLVTGLGGIVLAQPLQDSPQGRWTIVLATLIMRTARALQAVTGNTATSSFSSNGWDASSIASTLSSAAASSRCKGSPLSSLASGRHVGRTESVSSCRWWQNSCRVI